MMIMMMIDEHDNEYDNNNLYRVLMAAVTSLSPSLVHPTPLAGVKSTKL